VPPEERIATFDQDGTLWVEHPIYTQLVYCLDRVPVVVKEKPHLAFAARPGEGADIDENAERLDIREMGLLQPNCLAILLPRPFDQLGFVCRGLL
jgi:hypothetical protein